MRRVKKQQIKVKFWIWGPRTVYYNMTCYQIFFQKSLHPNTEYRWARIIKFFLTVPLTINIRYMFKCLDTSVYSCICCVIWVHAYSHTIYVYCVLCILYNIYIYNWQKKTETIEISMYICLWGGMKVIYHWKDTWLSLYPINKYSLKFNCSLIFF